ncbi:aldehyde dehydrogenase family protein [Frankia gtarii]|uniref:aldehyde dehydrogenase family protein n=1 Tax=Frankia gtarii TaxID=2950102 RepID=UPI0021BE984D|nr:aldehyde dehydrogenase family protein [Frankia gtarii]
MTSTIESPALASSEVSVPHYRLFIDGQWVDTSEQYVIVNPATEETVATAAKGGIDQADAAVAAARRAFEQGVWRSLPPVRRAAVLEAVADALEARSEELAATATREGGAPLHLSMGLNAITPVSNLRYFAELARRYQFEAPGPVVGGIAHGGVIRREPIGVCAAIVPWNFPLALAVWKIGPALAAGNSVVLKTDEKTPIGALELARELQAAGLPDGVFNVVTGDGEVVGAHLAAHPDVNKIGFTGSSEVGRKVAEAAGRSNLKRVTLELGGKGPNIVLADADMQMAVDGAIWGFLMHAGQACESGTRLLLPSSVHDRFVARLVERLATVRIGDPLDPTSNLGPLISAAQRDRVLRYVELARVEGATVACGGRVPAGTDKGYWVEPTVLTDVTNDMRVAREEIFGPVLCVLRYDTVDEAIEIANDSDFGLAAGVWSSNVDAALDVARRLEAGSVWINDFHMANENYPFGGFKQSGVGRELGVNALDAYTEAKSIQISMEPDIQKRAYGLALSTPAPAWGD